MTIAQIKALASENGYSISGNTKAQLIESFLKAQEG
jgi:hypothetical protein